MSRFLRRWNSKETLDGAKGFFCRASLQAQLDGVANCAKHPGTLVHCGFAECFTAISIIPFSNAAQRSVHRAIVLYSSENPELPTYRHLPPRASFYTNVCFCKGVSVGFHHGGRNAYVS